jgi:putative ABC transport system permease protein
MRTPLAWKNLTASWGKCLLAGTGVGFAVVLMFMQTGFRNALIDSNVQLFSLFNLSQANVAVFSRARYNLASELRYPRDTLDVMAAMPEVKQVGTVSIERGTATVQVRGLQARPIRVLALDKAAQEFLAEPALREQLLEADRQGACLIAQDSKPFYGFADTDEKVRLQHIELNGRALKATGLFRLGTDFGNDGTLLMSQRQHSQYFPWRSPTGRPEDLVDLAFLKVEPLPGRTIEQVMQQIQQLAPHLREVRTTRGLAQREKDFWSKATPVGKIFFIGTMMGLIVGAIICYQIQFTDINDHMSEFATLKAMGYSSGYFWRFILSQSFFLACLGFLPGCLASYAMYGLLSHYSGLVMMMTWDRVLLVWCLTLAMCVFSGGLAIRKLFRSDPASLF